MCGIAGFIGHDGYPGDLSQVAKAMADAIAHRGPDDAGVWTDPAAGVALAHRRLSIIDLSPAGHQPMLSEQGRWVITFNGEIYNHAELRREIERSGHAPPWRGHCDTEVLLAAIVAWGIRGALERSVGMFAFAAWDRNERTLVLARDRLGEKPLYYGWAGSSFLFGSELAALKEHPAWRGEIDRSALSLLLRHNYVPTPHSIYLGIGKLPPGSYFTLRPGQRAGHVEAYWDAADIAATGAHDPIDGSPGEIVEHSERLIRQSLAGQMAADVPLGAFLSGGVDSSAIVALMQDMSPRPVRTFSIGFVEEGYDEAPHAKAVARHLKTDHTELYVTQQQAMAVVPRLPALYGEPFADASQIPTVLVCELARAHVKVALSGDGGDELFSGYRRYGMVGQVWPLLARVPRRLRQGCASLIRSVAPAQWDRMFRLPILMLPQRKRPSLVGEKLHKAAEVMGLGSPAEVYDALVSFWQQPEKAVIGSEAPGTGGAAPVFVSQSDHDVRRMMHLDLVRYLPDDILVKVDRASMSVGLECRTPLLDHRLVEFTGRVPLAVLRRDGQSKWPLRQVLYRHVPRSLIERPKSGFAVPIDSWLRGPLREWAEGLLDARRLANEGFFNPEVIRAAWTSHQSGRRNLHHRLWSVLMFQAWHETQRSAPKRQTMLLR
jgi:asparagine synthase (glutamine-hydrolysing)